MKKFFIALVVFSALVAILVGLFRNQLLRPFFTPTTSSIPSGVTTAQLPKTADSPDNKPRQPTVVAQNLDIPWEIVFLPDNSFLVTERPGSLIRIFPDSQERIAIEGVVHTGEGGLQGLALDPNFAENSLLYLYLTSETQSGLINRVEQYRLDLATNQLADKQVVVDAIPGARYHDGGRIAFGPDNHLYVATGDAGQPEAAQDTQSLAGKILRLKTDGSAPADNPFGNLVFSLGHRNVQGLSWDSQNRLWATEHGPSGNQTGNDEVNLIIAGENYGWPTVRGQQQQTGMVSPVIESGTDETWAPAGMTILDDQLFFVGLRGEALYQATIVDRRLDQVTAHFRGDFGRLRFVRQGPDGYLYLGTSNTDGRGEPQPDDDKIIRFHPSILLK